jgi:hypothetical protein
MDIPKTDVGGSNRSARGCPAKKGQGLPEAFRRGNQMRREPVPSENGGKVKK